MIALSDGKISVAISTLDSDPLTGTGQMSTGVKFCFVHLLMI